MRTKLQLLTLLIVMSFIGCNKGDSDIDKNITMTLVSFTGCNTDTKSSGSNTPSIRFIGQTGDKLLISLCNTEFCCGTDSVLFNKIISDNNINIEIIDKGPLTYCYCPHNLDLSIGPLRNEKYSLTFVESENAYSRDTFAININYSQQLDTTIIGD